MKFAPLPSAEYIRECFRYNKRTGTIIWRKRPLHHFKRASGWKRWNKRYAGTPAFATINAAGHKTSAINKRLYLAHRVIWKLVTGKEPVGLIDHWDRRHGNNRWKNLREATHSENQFNKELGEYAGVHRTPSGNWTAFVTKHRKANRVGTFKTRKAALAARRIVAAEMYGEFRP